MLKYYILHGLKMYKIFPEIPSEVTGLSVVFSCGHQNDISASVLQGYFKLFFSERRHLGAAAAAAAVAEARLSSDCKDDKCGMLAEWK